MVVLLSVPDITELEGLLGCSSLEQAVKRRSKAGNKKYLYIVIHPKCGFVDLSKLKAFLINTADNINCATGLSRI